MIDERNTSLLRRVTDGAEAGNDVKGHDPGNGNEVDQGVAVTTTTEGAGLEFWNQHIFLLRFFVSLVNKRLIYDRLLFLLDQKHQIKSKR